MGGCLFGIAIRKMIKKLNNHVQIPENKALQNLFGFSRYEKMFENILQRLDIEEKESWRNKQQIMPNICQLLKND